jgi:hypothetical protein
VDLQVDTNVSKKHTVSIFSHDDGDSTFLQNVGIYLQVHMVLYNPEDQHRQFYHHENLKSYILYYFVKKVISLIWSEFLYQMFKFQLCEDKHRIEDLTKHHFNIYCFVLLPQYNRSAFCTPYQSNAHKPIPFSAFAIFLQVSFNKYSTETYVSMCREVKKGHSVLMWGFKKSKYHTIQKLLWGTLYNDKTYIRHDSIFPVLLILLNQR